MKNFLKRYVAYIVLFSLMLITTIIFLVIDINSGWTGEKTISCLFSVVMFVCGISTYRPLSMYILTNNSKMVKTNNELYRVFEEADQKSLLISYKTIKDREVREDKLKEINETIHEKNNNYPPLTHDTIDDFFKERLYYKKPLLFDEEVAAELIDKHNKYTELYSKEFEKKYSDYKTKDMIRRAPFPSLNTLLSFTFGVFGIFALLYQEVNVSEKLSNSLLVYLAVIGETILIGIFETLRTVQSAIPNEVEKNNKMIDDIGRLIRENN